MTKKTVNIHGRDYETVASRIQRFIEDVKTAKQRYCQSTVITLDEVGCLVKCIISVETEDGKLIKQASGHAYEQKGSSSINRTNHVENCETSAVGRALAFLGYGGDDSIASADEVITAISRKEKLDGGSKPSAPIVKPDDLQDDQLGNWVIPEGFKKYVGLTLNQVINQVTDSGKNKGIEYLEKIVATTVVPGSKFEGYKRVIERFLTIINKE